MDLALAQERRRIAVITRDIDRMVDLALGAENVSPSDKKKLKGLLKHYAKMKHPFTACVRDNTKRFGPEGAKRVCATLKDVIRGTTKWRGKEHMAMDKDIVDLILSIPDDELAQIYAGTLHLSQVEEALAQEPGEHGNPVEDEEEGDSSDVQLSAAELGHFFFSQAHEDSLELDGEGIWKTVLKTGTWNTRPGPGGKVLKKPLHVVKEGPVKRGQVSLKELHDAFKDGAVEHVTIPLSHQDRVDENTGQIKDVRIVDDGDGGARLEALHEFTDSEVSRKVQEKSILNTSCGILFDYIRKRDGKKYPMVLGHVALTNKPWIDGMEPFGSAALSQDGTATQVYAVESTDESHPGGDKMGKDEQAAAEEKAKQDAAAAKAKADAEAASQQARVELSQELGLTAEEIKDKLERYSELESKLHTREVEAKTKDWSEAGVPPAVVTAAKEIMLADDGNAALMLSQGDQETTLTASELVERIVNAVPKLDLSDQTRKVPVSGAPKDDAEDEIEPHEVKVRAAELALADHTLSEEDAIKKARKELRLDASESNKDES